MQGFQGAVLRIKLRRLYAWTARRQEIAREYRRLLAGARVEIPVDDPRDECVYHQFVIYASNRNALIAQLTARGNRNGGALSAARTSAAGVFFAGLSARHVSSRRARVRARAEPAGVSGNVGGADRFRGETRCANLPERNEPREHRRSARIARRRSPLATRACFRSRRGR